MPLPLKLQISFNISHCDILGNNKILYWKKIYISNILASNGEYSTIAKELSNGLKGTNPIIFARGSDSGSVSDTITDLTGAGIAFAKKYKESTGVDVLGSLLGSKFNDTLSK